MLTPEDLTTNGIAWVDAIAKVVTEVVTQVGSLAALVYLTYDKLISNKLIKERVDRVSDKANMALAMSGTGPSVTSTTSSSGGVTISVTRPDEPGASADTTVTTGGGDIPPAAPASAEPIPPSSSTTPTA